MRLAQSRLSLPLCLLPLLLAGLVPFLAGQARAQDVGPVQRLAPELQLLVQRLGPARRPQGPQPQVGLAPQMMLADNNGRVGVRITAAVPSALAEPLRALGMGFTGIEDDHHFLEGYLPVGSLPELEQLGGQGLLGVTAMARPVVFSGLVNSQGDAIMEADRVRATAVTGAGYRVGVMSDSFDKLGGKATGVANGELPASVNILQEGPANGTDEGRAMAEIVYDLAPGATQAFASVYYGESHFASMISSLANPSSGNCQILVDDVIYLTEPMFQDGVIAQAVDTAVNSRGVCYFSAAGNQATQAYMSTSFNTSSDSGYGNCHDFNSAAGTDTRQRVTIGSGQTVQLVLQWDDPFYTASGVDTDLNFYLLTAGSDTVLASATTNNITNQSPYEYLTYTNSTGATVSADLLIKLNSGPAPLRVKYVYFGSLGISEYATNSPMIYGHAAADNAMAVGAVNYYDQGLAASFTSAGPCTILFNASGTRYGSAVTREKPDIAAIQGCDNSFFGNDIDSTGYPNFSGTSAAAPHAAAVAALVKQQFPSMTPAEVYDRMSTYADPSVATSGFDYYTGAGLVNAYDAVYGSSSATTVAFSDGFESKGLSLAYETRTTKAARIQVTTANTPAAGSYHLVLDNALNHSSYAGLSEVILHLNLASRTNVVLSFKEKEFSDNDEAMPSTFSGSGNYDGVALSVDGTNWYSLFSLTGSTSTNSYQTQTSNISTFASGKGLTLNSNTRIKFQHYGTAPVANSEGMAFDDISVTATNAAPVAVADSYTTTEDTAVVKTAAAGVLANDTDADGNTLSAIKVTNPSHGSVTLGSDGSFTYTPTANYNGSDSFTYKANDGAADSSTVTVSFTITAVNDAPTVVNDSYSVNEDATLTVAASGVLANDSDPEGSTITATKVTNPSHGSVTLNSNGSFTYTPTANYNGADSFTYKANDGSLDSSTATVSITVNSVNDLPTATNDSYSTNEDTALTVAAPGVLNNDSDIDNTLTAIKVTNPSHGSVTLNSDGSFTYTPTANYNGSDSFTYKANDGTVSTSNATVSLTVNAVNDAPTAGNDSYTTTEDTTLTIPFASSVTNNDSDPEGVGLTANKVTDPAHGTLTLNLNGSFTYVPVANYNGTDSFTYRASDGSLNSNTATVTITITAVNDPPVAVADTYTVSEDMSLAVAASGVLNNDTDVEGSTLTAIKVTNPSHGTLTLNSNGALSYTPTANYSGSDSFTYRANDGTTDGNTVTVTLNVTPVNDTPTVANDSYSTSEDTPLTVAAPGVLSNDADLDGDTLAATKLTDPSHGSVTLNSDGGFTYTPGANYSGSDSFTYRVNDGTVNSGTATVNLTVNAVNDPPIVVNDSYTVTEDQVLSVAAAGVLANDTDVEGSPLTAAKVGNPAHGSVTLNSNGGFTYTPVANYSGSDSFTYKANDGTTESSTATVNISVSAVNDAPVAVGDSYTTAEDTVLSVAVPGVLSNDSDVDDEPLTATRTSEPAHGTVKLFIDGNFIYTPAANYSGTDSFTYYANDGNVDSNTVTVTITVTAVNDPPVATSDSYSVNEDQVLTVAAAGVLANDTDVEGSPLTAAKVGDPAHGVVTLNSNGSFTYTPAANYSGADSFTYRANDGTTNSATATVSITVNAVNDVPVAANDSYTTAEDTALTVAAPGVLSNDTDADSDPLMVTKLTDPAHGTVSLNGDGAFTYTPAADYSGPDSFTYRANDGTSNSGTATVALTVTAVNDAPTAMNDGYTTAEDTPLTVSAAGVLGNDTDVDGNPLSAVKQSEPAHGTVTLNANGSFLYTPDANFNGSDSFTYRADDGGTSSTVAVVTITVTTVNDAPTAQDDAYNTAEDTALTVAAAGVLGNDYDVDGDPLIAAKVGDPAHGSVTLNGDGSFTYTPAANYSGSDSFTYKASDGTANSATVTVSLTVTAVNDAPSAQPDSYTVAEDNTLTVAAAGLLSNDTDVEGSPLTAMRVSNAAHGTAAVNSNGGFTYLPDANYSGPDSFTYSASDGTTSSGAVTVTLTVTPVNDPPAAASDAYSTDEDTALTLAAPGVLGNDTDVDGDTLAAAVVATVSHGTLTLNGNGGFTYTPTANYSGSDGFTYRTSDGASQTGPTTVTLTIRAVNDAPAAGNDAYTTSEDTAVTVAAPGVLSNDSDMEGSALTAMQVAGPSHGSLTLNGNGSFTYTPEANYFGADSFTYRARDTGNAQSAIATVFLTVTAVNDPPTAQADSYTTAEDTALTVPAAGVLVNDTDPDGDTLTAAKVSNPSHGTLMLGANGGFTYTPAANYSGSDSFTYQASDGNVETVPVTVSLTVTAVNDPPVAQNDSYTIGEDGTLTVAALGVLANDSDAEGTPLTAAKVSNPSHGSLTLNSNGGFTYTPGANFHGADSFSYQASDGSASTTATVSLAVTSINDTPVVVNDSYTVNEDQTLTVNPAGVLSNDTDADGDPLTATLASAPSHGTAALNGDGSFTYTPSANYHGPDSFTYQVGDGTVTSAPATVSLTVTSVPDAPVAQNDSYATGEDTPLTVAAPGVLGNDSDVDGDALSAVLVSNVMHGTLTLQGTGGFTYTPEADYSGPDSFTYRDSTSGGGSNTATVTLAVGAENDPPVVQPDGYTTLRGTVLTVAAPGLLGNDHDPEGSTLSAVLVDAPARGTVTLNGDGSFRYTPRIGTTGVDTFTYRASDGSAQSAPVTVTINVGTNPPASTTGAVVTGSGKLGAGRGVPSFKLSAKMLRTGTVKGSFSYKATGIDFKSTLVSAVIVSGDHARVFGKGQLKGGPSIDFVVDVDDLGKGPADRFKLETGGTLSVGETALTTGDIKVKP